MPSWTCSPPNGGPVARVAVWWCYSGAGAECAVVTGGDVEVDVPSGAGAGVKLIAVKTDGAALMQEEQTVDG